MAASACSLRPPTVVRNPFISPDGKRVAFGTDEENLYLINSDGSHLQKFGSRPSLAPNWSPDGTRLVFTHGISGEIRDLQLFNVQTGELTALPQLAGFTGGQWVGADDFVALAAKDRQAPKIYNLKPKHGQTWCPEPS